MKIIASATPRTRSAIVGIAFAAASLLALSGPPVLGAEPAALQILDRADDKWELNLRNADTELELLVYREKELRKTYRMVVKYQDTDHVLVETVYPPRNEGEKMLQAGRKNFWIFLPNINRAVRISESNSLSNSDFSNTDLLSPRLSKEYTPRLLGTEKLGNEEAYKLELTASDESTSYAKIVYWVRKPDYAPLRRDYYTYSQQLLKRLDLRASNPPKPGLPAGMPDTLVMRSVLEKDKETVLRYTKRTPGVSYGPETFRESALMKR